MICPHCLVSIFDKPEYRAIGIDADGLWNLAIRPCPACSRLILHLETDAKPSDRKAHAVTKTPMGLDWFPIKDPITIMVRPKGSSRPPCPAEVPEKIKEDYVEACLVLSDSAKASAALSRRCLQHILRDHANVKPGTLGEEVTEVINRDDDLPPDIVRVIRAPQELGNIAAHPMRDDVGKIVDVEPWEAEWMLEILEMLFNHYFVRRAETERRMNAIHSKYVEARRNV